MFTLTMKNVGTIGNLCVEIKPGLTTIQGVNGSGKSTVVDALYFALTGEPLKLANIQSLITWGEPHMEVTLTCEEYTVSRKVFASSTPTQHVLTVGAQEPIRRKDEVNEWLLNYYNVTSTSVLRNVYFAEQFKAIDELITCRSSARIDLMIDVFGFKKFEKIRDVFQTALTSLQVNDVSVELMTQLEMTADKTSQAVIEAQAQLDVVDAKLKELGTDEEVLRNKAERSPTRTEVADQTTAQSTALGKIESAKKALTDIPAAISKEDHQSAQNAIMYIAKKAEADQWKLQLDAELSRRQPASSEIRTIQQAAHATIAGRQATIDALNRRRALIQNGKCPLTSGEPCPDLRAMTDTQTIDADVLKETNLMQEDKVELESLNKMEQSSLAYEATVKDLQFKLDSANAAVAQYEPYKDFDVKDYEERKAKYESSNTLFQQWTTEKSVQQAIYDKATEKLAEYAKYPTLADEQVREYCKKQYEEYKQLKEQKTQHAATLQARKEAETEAMTSLATARKQQAEAADRIHKRAVMQKARELCHRDRVPRLLLEVIRRSLNKKIDDLVGLFEFPYTVLWTPEGKLMYDPIIGPVLEVTKLSGGQQYVLALIIKCAMAEQTESTFPLLVLDEPTTGLDVTNRHILANMLKNMTSILGRRGVAMLAPTHDELITGAADQNIKLQEVFA